MNSHLTFSSLDLNQLNRDFNADLDGAGATVTFTGFVRDFNAKGKLDGLELEHYPGITEKALQELASKSRAKFNCLRLVVVHRVGKIENHEPIVWVGAASHHRQSAFDAAMYTMDVLKQSVPLWKKEWMDGKASWVDAKDSDKVAASRW